jgi:putative SOS response-associated peptidase YedK
MCSVYYANLTAEKLQREQPFSVLEGYSPRLNRGIVRPTDWVDAICQQGVLQPMRWGFSPSWSQEDWKAKLINIRSETVEEKPMFKAAFRGRRAVLPVSGYFEWVDEEVEIPSPQGTLFDEKPLTKIEQRKFALVVRGHDPFFFPALFEDYLDPNGSEIRTVGLLTCEPNGFTRRFHTRMPVVLTGKQAAEWLKRGTGEMLGPPAFAAMDAIESVN